VPKSLAAFGSIDILHKKRLESWLSIALLCAKCFHHKVMENFWDYKLQNGETQTNFFCMKLVHIGG